MNRSLFLEHLESRILLSADPTILWDGGANTFNALDADNWTDDRLPNASDHVLIGYLNSTNPIVVAGNLSVLSLVSHANLQVNGTLATSQESSITGDLTLGATGQVQVQGGELEIHHLNNSGSVIVHDGATLKTTEGGASGTFAVQQGAILRFGGGPTETGNYSLASGASVTGLGKVQVDGGGVTVEGAFDVGGLDVSFGSITFNHSATVAGGSLYAYANLGGTATLTVTGAFHWYAGVMSGTGTTAISADGNLLLYPGDGELRFLHDRTISNAGHVTWYGGTLGTDHGNGGTLVNLATGVVEVGEGGIYPDSSVASNAPIVVENRGIWRVNAGGGHFEIDRSSFNNTKTVEVLAGRLLLSRGSNSGRMTTSSGATLQFGFAEQGDYTLASGSILDGPGVALVEAGGLHLGTGNSTARTLSLAGGGINGSGVLTISEAFNWIQGTLAGVSGTSGAGKIVIAREAILNLPGSNSRVLAGLYLDNRGRTVWNVVNGGEITRNDDTFRNIGLPPTVGTLPPTFDPEASAITLYNALHPGMTGWGYNSDPVYNTLYVRSLSEIEQIKTAYQSHYQRNLIADINANLWAADLARVNQLLLGSVGTAVADALTIKQALTWWTGAGPTIVKVLEVKTAAQIDAIALAFQEQAETSLLTALNAISDGGYRDRAKALVETKSALVDAIAIRQALTSGWVGADMKVIHQILRNRTPEEIASILSEFSQKYGVNLGAYLLSSNLPILDKNGIFALLNGNSLAADANRIRAAIVGWGTDEEAVWSTLDGTTSDYRAMLAQVYQPKFGVELKADIIADFNDTWLTGYELKKTLSYYHKGGLSDGEKLWYAVAGWGTTEETVRSVLANRTTEEIQRIIEEYQAAAQENGNWAGNLAADLQRELSNRDWLDAQLALQGRATSVRQAYEQASAKRNFERVGWANSFNSGWQSMFNDHGANLDRSWNELQTAYNNLTNNGELEVALDHASAANFRRILGRVNADVTGYRTARDAGTEIVATGLGTVAGVLVVIGSGGMATPLVVSLAAGVGGLSQTLGAALVRGGFEWEELPADVLAGMVNGGTAVITGGNVTATGGWGFFRQTTINSAKAGLAGGALSGAVSTALREGTWENGIQVGVLQIAQSALISGLAGLGLGGIIGASAATFQVTGAAGFVRSALPTWLTRPFSSSATASFRELAEAELGSILNAEKQAIIQQVLNKLAGLPTDATEATVRTAIREVLGPEAQLAWRELFEETGVVTWSATKTLTAAEVSAFYKAALQQTLLQQADLLDSLVQKLVAKGIASDVAKTNAVSLADELSRLNPDATATEIRAILQQLNPEGTISDDVVSEARQWLSETRRHVHAAQANRRMVFGSGDLEKVPGSNVASYQGMRRSLKEEHPELFGDVFDDNFRYESNLMAGENGLGVREIDGVWYYELRLQRDVRDYVALEELYHLQQIQRKFSNSGGPQACRDFLDRKKLAEAALQGKSPEQIAAWANESPGNRQALLDYLESMNIEREAKQWVMNSQYLADRYASRADVLAEVKEAIRQSLKTYEADRKAVEDAIALLGQTGP